MHDILLLALRRGRASLVTPRTKMIQRAPSMFKQASTLPRLCAVISLVMATMAFVGPVEAQHRIVAEPEAIDVSVGASTPLSVAVVDEAGKLVDIAVRLAAPRRVMTVRNGRVQGLAAGEFEIVATAVLEGGQEGTVPALRIPVVIGWPAIERVEVGASANALFVGTTVSHNAYAFHADGTRRPKASASWRSSAPATASVDEYGTLTAHTAGPVTLTATFEGVRTQLGYTVDVFPATSLEIEGGAATARTGDVVRFEASGQSSSGIDVENLPITWAYTFVPDDSIAAPGSPAIMDAGALVAEVPGRYTVLAMSGPLMARRTIRISPRQSVQKIELQGQGSVSDVHTSDLWLFEGIDGRDYAVTGTWGGDGWAYFWDATNPANIFKTDSLQIDARTVNDVKVAPGARYAALSREGASNRRNGVVILDMADPAHPIIASTFESNGVTGGVHNMFATDDYLFALAGGDKYVIIDVRDPYAPTYVSEYNHPDSRIHDVWVHDGVAYSSEWQTGVVVVDVGNGRWGGSIDNPTLVTSVPYPVGRTHAAFPYFQESTGSFYLFLGDEILTRTGAAFEGYGSDNAFDAATGEGGVQSPSSGYVHIIDFTDPENPRDVARYEVPEAGTHNMWVEDDVLYQAYYEGGLRIVDVSGELKGNLARQGRDIAVFKPFDPQGYLVNQPNVWGAQPYKGHIFFSDFNSGLWAAKLHPKGRPVS